MGLRSINLQAVVRFVRSRQAGFEAVGMGLEDRAKLRRLLLSAFENPQRNNLLPLSCLCRAVPRSTGLHRPQSSNFPWSHSRSWEHGPDARALPLMFLCL